MNSVITTAATTTTTTATTVTTAMLRANLSDGFFLDTHRRTETVKFLAT